MALFLSSFVQRIDRKGRVSVPAAFRAALGGDVASGIVLVKSPIHPALDGFSNGMMEDIVARIDDYAMFSPEQDALGAAILAQAVPLVMDSEGRISIPLGLLDYMGVAESVVFAGLGRKFQIWSPEGWEKQQAAAQATIVRDGLTLPRSKGIS